MQLFRIVKEAEKSYQLLRKLDERFMNGKEVWDVVKSGITCPLQAKAIAHGVTEHQVGDVVEEFVI